MEQYRWGKKWMDLKSILEVEVQDFCDIIDMSGILENGVMGYVNYL